MLFLLDKDYIACLLDILIVSGILVVNSSFTAMHKLANNRREELLASYSSNIEKELCKVYTYLKISFVANIISLFVILWLFWPLEFLFLFLLSYKVFSL